MYLIVYYDFLTGEETRTEEKINNMNFRSYNSNILIQFIFRAHILNPYLLVTIEPSISPLPFIPFPINSDS